MARSVNKKEVRGEDLPIGAKCIDCDNLDNIFIKIDEDKDFVYYDCYSGNAVITKRKYRKSSDVFTAHNWYIEYPKENGFDKLYERLK